MICELGKVFEGFCGESGEKEEERDGVGVVNRGDGDECGERGGLCGGSGRRGCGGDGGRR